MFDQLPLESVAGWPVYVSLAAARAFARWRGERLPPEAEFHRAAFCQPDGGQLAGAPHVLPWGEATPADRRGNVGVRRWAPTPVGSHPEAASAWGVPGPLGDGGGWTSTRSNGPPALPTYIPGNAGYFA